MQNNSHVLDTILDPSQRGFGKSRNAMAFAKEVGGIYVSAYPDQIVRAESFGIESVSLKTLMSGRKAGMKDKLVFDQDCIEKLIADYEQKLLKTNRKLAELIKNIQKLREKL